MFQIHNKVIQLYIYTHIIFEIILHYRLLQVIDYSSLCKNQYFQSLTHHAAYDPDAPHLETSPNAKLSTQAQRETAGDRKRWRHPHAHRLGICWDFHIHKVKYSTAIIKGQVEKRRPQKSVNSLHLLISNRDRETRKETRKAVSGVSYTKRVIM